MLELKEKEDEPWKVIDKGIVDFLNHCSNLTELTIMFCDVLELFVFISYQDYVAFTKA
jgi:hypothetical protein